MIPSNLHAPLYSSTCRQDSFPNWPVDAVHPLPFPTQYTLHSCWYHYLTTNTFNSVSFQSGLLACGHFIVQGLSKQIRLLKYGPPLFAPEPSLSPQHEQDTSSSGVPEYRNGGSAPCSAGTSPMACWLPCICSSNAGTYYVHVTHCSMVSWIMERETG